MKKRLTWADYKVMLNKTGWNATQVGKSLGISSSVISQRFTALGIDFRKEKAAHIASVRQVRLDLFRKEFVNAGYSIQVLAKKLNLPEDEVRRRIRWYGFRRLPEGTSVYPLKADVSSLEKLRTALGTIQAETGIEFTLHEALRAAVYEFARRSGKHIYWGCLDARGRAWKLAKRPYRNAAKRRAE